MKWLSLIIFILPFSVLAQTVEDEIQNKNISNRTDHKNNFKTYPLAYTKTGQKSFDNAKIECTERALNLYNRDANKDYENYNYQFNNCMSKYIPFKDNNDCLQGQTITFGTGGACKTTLTSTIFDGDNTGLLSNENSGYSGNANFKCDKGVLTPITETCEEQASGDCEITAEQVFTMEIENKAEVGFWRTEKMNTCSFKVLPQTIAANGTVSLLPEEGLRVNDEYNYSSNFKPIFEGQLNARCNNGNLVVESQTCKAKIMNCLSSPTSIIDNMYFSKVFGMTSSIRTHNINGKNYNSLMEIAGAVSQGHLSNINYLNEFVDSTKTKEVDLLTFSGARSGFKFLYSEKVMNENVFNFLGDRDKLNSLQESFINNIHIKHGQSVSKKLFSPYFKYSDAQVYENDPDYYMDEQTWAAIPYNIASTITDKENQIFSIRKRYDNYTTYGNYGLVENYKNLRGDNFDGEVVLSCHDGLILIEDLKFSVNETPSCTNHEIYYTPEIEKPLAWSMVDNKTIWDLCPSGDYCEAARLYTERGSRDYNGIDSWGATSSRVQFTATNGTPRSVSRSAADLLQDENNKIDGLTCLVNNPLGQYPLKNNFSIPLNGKVEFNSESSVYSGKGGYTCSVRKGYSGTADLYYLDKFSENFKGYSLNIRDTTDTCHFINEAEQFQKCYFVGTTNCPSKILENGEKMSCSEVDAAELQCVDGLIGVAQ